MANSLENGLTEFEKMVSGLVYSPADEDLLRRRRKALSLVEEFNAYIPNDSEKAAEIARKLFGFFGDNNAIMAHFACDYGENISIGSNCYINYNCVVLDCAPVTIGNNVLIGPNCGIYTAIHPLDSEKRLQGLETAQPITIKDGVWLGGNVVVLPGVTIGEKTVIGAGSVVTKDIPAHVLAYGNPCRVIKTLP
ncbi:TPA: maltose O-acetyltransferase [bacterium UBP9_UBA11836]|nr:maltose O-acetyltransferase [bacterium UBP9_UBA11836]